MNMRVPESRMNVPANTEDNRKTKKQLIHELQILRKKIADSGRLLNDSLVIYKHAPIGLCVFDLDLRFLHINKWLAAMNGVPIEKHLGRTILEVLPDVAAVIEPQLRQVIDTGKPILGGTVRGETRAWPGIKRMFQHNYYPLKSDDSAVVGVSCVVEDVTERRQAENDALKARGELELRVDERTSEIIAINAKLLEEIADRKRAEKALSFQATHDALTLLVNRREFERRVARVVDTARKQREEHVLCYLDLDQFKVINDTCGHMAGDDLLRQLGQLMLMVVRKRDTLGRLGGDEFGILMEHCTISQARRAANKLCMAVEGFRFVWNERRFRIGVSIGLVPITESTESVGNVFSAADRACYAAKDDGGNRVCVYRSDDMDVVRRQDEMQWVARIDRALEDQRLRLWSQPIVPMMTDSGEGGKFELLLRLIDEHGNIIRPGVFLPAAERYGLSTKLDRWVVGTALDWLSRDPKILEQLHLCFINLSSASLVDEQFIRFVCEQLDQSKITSQKICFEITETTGIADLSRARSSMATLKEHGCRFALDDFGSGSSSFAYLNSLPVDYVKIAGLFVKNIEDNSEKLALVRSIHNVGRVMGKQTIAESVENEAILGKLREIGVDYAQGYFFGAPMPIEKINLVDVLERGHWRKSPKAGLGYKTNKGPFPSHHRH